MMSLNSIAEKLSGHKTILISTHVSPDPDAIGSSCGLALALNSVGKKAVVYLGDPVPRIMNEFVAGVTFVKELPNEQFDAVVVVDTASRRRINGDGEKVFGASETVFNIDHHISNDGWGTENFINPDRSSCAEIVLELLAELRIKPTAAVANLLLAGLMDDTGSFRFRNTSADSFEHAAILVSLGASPQHVSNLLYFSVPQHVTKLRAAAVSGLKMHGNGKIAFVAVTQSMLDECGAKAEDTDGVVEEIRAMEGVLVAVFMRELEKGWKFSLRSKSDAVDVNEVAMEFGGGGHKAAAGCRVDGNQSDAAAAVVSKVEIALKKAGH